MSDVPNEPLTPHEAAALRRLWLVALEAGVLQAFEWPAGLAEAMVKVARIAGKTAPLPPVKYGETLARLLEEHVRAERS